ncbi:WbuC family cupin fold metalloprotein [Paraferrimonas sp. SM1919]|uniref:WbuC family cupin fold metalloprotein n=1 Tax=Paraferrimonas sp. SM1919 TaxID=2662263 RepID=UPI0013D5CF7A|nr:WbuC family cupin fold metalloprotein [Paraferrimonas sp. SM1919]
MTKVITAEQLIGVNQAAMDAPRRRSNLNVHASSEDAIQRLFIATEPDTYIRPHRHVEQGKWEFFMVLQGEIDLLIFDEAGTLTERHKMTPDNVRAVEVPQGTWHTYVVEGVNTLAIEVKHGPYIPTSEEDFAVWSPAENTPEAPVFREKLRTLKIGESLV